MATGSSSSGAQGVHAPDEAPRGELRERCRESGGEREELAHIATRNYVDHSGWDGGVSEQGACIATRYRNQAGARLLFAGFARADANVA